MALAMRYANPFFYSQLMLNRWNGHTGNANGADITTASTWNGTGATYIPDNATHVMLGWHNDITSSSPTDWVHAGIAGSSASNTGHFATSSHNSAYSTTVIGFSVSGWSDASNAQWHFRDMPAGGYDYLPRGISRGNLNHNSNYNATNDLLGAIADSCNNFTSQYGVATITPTSETYVGNRKDIDASGAGGSYCSVPSSSNNDGWTMWWR